MDELIKEGEDKYREVLRKYKVSRIASLIAHKVQLQEQIKKIDIEIKEMENVVVIPEGASYISG